MRKSIVRCEPNQKPQTERRLFRAEPFIIAAPERANAKSSQRNLLPRSYAGADADAGARAAEAQDNSLFRINEAADLTRRLIQTHSDCSRSPRREEGNPVEQEGITHLDARGASWRGSARFGRHD